MATIFTTNNNNKDNKIAILYYIPLPKNDIITKTIKLHIPDGRAASPFYPPLPPTVTGWLLCESLSNSSGRLMPQNNKIAIFH